MCVLTQTHMSNERLPWGPEYLTMLARPYQKIWIKSYLYDISRYECTMLCFYEKWFIKIFIRLKMQLPFNFSITTWLSATLSLLFFLLMSISFFISMVYYRNHCSINDHFIFCFNLNDSNGTELYLLLNGCALCVLALREPTDGLFSHSWCAINHFWRIEHMCIIYIYISISINMHHRLSVHFSFDSIYLIVLKHRSSDLSAPFANVRLSICFFFDFFATQWCSAYAAMIFI